jgi:hypothetical protein
MSSDRLHPVTLDDRQRLRLAEIGDEQIGEAAFERPEVGDVGAGEAERQHGDDTW